MGGIVKISSMVNTVKKYRDIEYRGTYYTACTVVQAVLDLRSLKFERISMIGLPGMYKYVTDMIKIITALRHYGNFCIVLTIFCASKKAIKYTPWVVQSSK